ncbi:MAG: redoxin domain-containing protein [Saprospiraceae bacterium]|nr:redoxin domain-containing protein [Saprospiraceae bacterium]MCF8251828.1 redoxin domain-containing protein [Saprospiraceae bacterium]MCF8281963.1 redoxin domain-containing protein [Bacteroidales bacterium]MCF8313302.1 redoxin domain-containing protein [Saprospiraceae bacterium]MCF8441742.1 redoxin domain-containing protein [Saprospiraceae bacterium]
MALQTGDKAPDFKLYNTERVEVSLNDYQGRNLLILFYPAAFTSVCTKELCSTRDDIAFYQGIGADVVAVSVDTVFTLKQYKEEQELNFPLLSDFNKEMSEAYGTLYNEWILGMKGVSKRSAFIVDSKGIIRYAEVLESAGDLPNFGAIKATLKEPGN